MMVDFPGQFLLLGLTGDSILSLVRMLCCLVSCKLTLLDISEQYSCKSLLRPFPKWRLIQLCMWVWPPTDALESSFLFSEKVGSWHGGGGCDQNRQVGL